MKITIYNIKVHTFIMFVLSYDFNHVIMSIIHKRVYNTFLCTMFIGPKKLKQPKKTKT